MAEPMILDHVGIRVADLEGEILRWRELGFEVTAFAGSMAIVRLADGVRLALLGPGSTDPSHVALRTRSSSQFEAWRTRERAPVSPDPGGGGRFFAKGGPGLALEVIWHPGEAPGGATPPLQPA